MSIWVMKCPKCGTHEQGVGCQRCGVPYGDMDVVEGDEIIDALNNEADLSRQLAECREKLEETMGNYSQSMKTANKTIEELIASHATAAARAEAAEAALAKCQEKLEAAEAELALALKERDTALDALSASELAATAALAKEQEKAARMVEALKFYADKDHYLLKGDVDSFTGRDWTWKDVLKDNGERASATLDALLKRGGGE